MSRLRFLTVLGSCIAVFLLVVALAVFVVLWNNLNSEWAVEETDAQYVLNHSPLNHIESESVFTASGVEHVFRGLDVFGRSWYAILSDSTRKIHAVPTSILVSTSFIRHVAKAHSVELSSVHFGWLSTSTATRMNTHPGPVYEVFGIEDKRPVYLYFRATTGRLICQYVLHRQ